MVSQEAKYSQLDDYSIVEDQIVEEYKVYPYRFVILTLFCLGTMNLIIIACIYIPLQTNLRDIYGGSLASISFGTLLLFNLSYIPGGLIASYIVPKFGLRMSLCIGGFISVMAFWAQALCQKSYYFLPLGEALAGLSFGIYCNNPEKLATTWFPPKERPFATGAITQTINASVGIGVPFISYFLNLTQIRMRHSIK